VPGAIHVAYLKHYPPAWSGALESGVADVFPLEVRGTPLNIDLKPAYAPDRRQYHATLILASLLRHLPDKHTKIVGVTPVDLYIPVLTFVFGQAQLNGPGAVISTYRLRNEFYGLPPDDGLLLERAIKEAVHELGHAFGLVHCPSVSCVMHASSYVEDVDIKGESFCTNCMDTLEAGVETLGRYAV